jgi:hypothetical protein
VSLGIQERKELELILDPLGFRRYSHSGDGSCCTYVDDHGIAITVDLKHKTAQLRYMATLLFSLETGWFSWPHPRFEAAFLVKMRELVKRMQESS